MEFRTKINIQASKDKIDHRTSVLMLGSCFAENIGVELKNAKFNIIINPFGILYNPQSVSQALDIIGRNRVFTENDIFQYNGLYHSYYHHGDFSDQDSARCLEKINSSILTSSSQLPKTDVLIVTFGTAYVYKLEENGLVVGNCHKLPASRFNRYRMDVNLIVGIWKETIKMLRRINPQMKIIFTVSPVRHLKDGTHENQLSKSVLLLAIDKLCSECDKIDYFPSYEIVMDELRDYRFYAEDMLHVNDIAVKYIWEKFKDTYFSQETNSIIDEWSKLALAIGHRPFNPQSGEYKHFLKQTLLKVEGFQRKYPYIYCEKEITFMSESLEGIG